MKAKIAVLFGGCSSEYPISLQSAYSVLTNIDNNEYEVIPIGITREGNWFFYQGNYDWIIEDKWIEQPGCIPVVLSPNKQDHGIILFGENGIERIKVDMVFPVLHGKNGEDGTVQGLCELAGIPVIGCGMLSSALCMDKNLAHTLVSYQGILVPKAIVLKTIQIEEQELLAQVSQLKFPVYVKPMKAGSSFGITKVNKKEELMLAVKMAFDHDNEVIIEENIDGFEVGCAILGMNGNDLIIGEVDEIELSNGFFDYTEKYTLKSSKIHMPARITLELSEEIKKTALLIYDTLACSGFARIDMFLTPEGNIVFNEVNTIPGFTSHSRYPNMLKGIGMTFEQILNQLISLVIKNENNFSR